jgi:glycine/D-amino acid oxidase-like deaminating enzyme
LVHYDSIVIGGGFYGARLALALRAEGESVLLLEREPMLLGRASLINQARVHQGYHYPRSILTAVRSRQNYDRFREEYAEAVYESFDHYYAIARNDSKTTAAQFAQFCQRLGAPASPAPDRIRALFDSARIEDVFLVRECAFDAVKLRERMSRDLNDAGVEVLVRARVTRARRDSACLCIAWTRDGSLAEATATRAYNCTYSKLNEILAASGASAIPLKRELTEMALIEPPDELRNVGVTVMDGPFFSMMPYPSRPGLCTLSHVRYTPHTSWHDAPGSPPLDSDTLRGAYATRFPHMVRDAARFLPAIAGARYVESLFEVKGIMPRSEQDDSRPILFRESAELPGFFSVLGAKIDSVYDVEEHVIPSAARDPHPALSAVPLAESTPRNEGLGMTNL